MKIIVISFVACLTSAENECKNVVIEKSEEEISLTQCNIFKPFIEAEWTARNTDYFITGSIECEERS